jgi:hypothetical protein
MAPPENKALTEGATPIEPDPLIVGISKKLTGLFAEERNIFWKIILIWYCSKVLAYFADICPKSGVRGELHPLMIRSSREARSDFFMEV